MGAELITLARGKTSVAGPGLYRMPAKTYHDDPAPEPSLSGGGCNKILDETPRHFHLAHPRLGGQAEEIKEEKVELGSVVHELLLDHGGGYEVLDFDDYRTKAAKEARDEAIAAGMTPILRHKMETAERMVLAIRATLAEIPAARDAFDGKGASEVVGVWRDEIGIWGRMMLDRWGPEPTQLWDLKTTMQTLTDRNLASLIDGGISTQLMWYRRGLHHLLPDLAGRLRYNIVFVEQSPPHEVRVVAMTSDQQTYGTRRAIYAAVMFQHAMETGHWPGYAREISYVESKPWVMADWSLREQTDPLFRDIGQKLARALSPFGALEG